MEVPVITVTVYKINKFPEKVNVKKFETRPPNVKDIPRSLHPLIEISITGDNSDSIIHVLINIVHLS